MDKYQTVKNILAENGSIAKTEDFISAGLSNWDVSNLCNQGFIERIRQGYYRLVNQEVVLDEQLLTTLLPDTILCMESALFYYGYSDFTPRKWNLAVPRTYSRSKLNATPLPLHPYYIQPSLFELGKTEGDFKGIKLSVYDRERTICDCFKYRNKMNRETFIKALHAYVEDINKNLNKLTEYAKEMSVYKKLNDILDVMLTD